MEAQQQRQSSKSPPKRLNTQGLHGSIRTILAQTTTKEHLVHYPIIKTRQLQLSLGNEFNAGSISLLDQERWACHLLLGMRMILQKQNLGLRYQLQLYLDFLLTPFLIRTFFSQYDDSFPSLMDADNTFTSENSTHHHSTQMDG